MKLGNIATGADFSGREREIKELWRYLEGEHVVLPGARRLGKTSILRRLESDADKHGVMAKAIDVSGVQSAAGFVQKLEAAFPDKGVAAFLSDHAQAVGAWLKRINTVKMPGVAVTLNPPSTTTTWQQKADALQARLQEQPLLLLLDEFPVMLINLEKKEAEALLQWLRSWRQSQGNVCRFVFTGSIGLQALLERMGWGTTMNDCYRYPLGPFSLKDAEAAWRGFAEKEGFASSKAVTDDAFQRIAWLSPFYVCLLLDHTMRAARERLEESSAAPDGAAQRLTTNDVATAYDNLLVERSRFHHWEDRLKETLPPAKFQFCQDLLTHLAHAKDGLTLRQLDTRLAKRVPNPDKRAALLEEVRIQLEDEGYITPPGEGGRIHFRSFLLRDWWRRNHV